MKFLFKSIRIIVFTSCAFFLLCIVNPQKGTSGFVYKMPLAKPSPGIDLKIKLIGEIIGYSYIKMVLESSGNGKHYKNKITPLKGSYYEAINSKTYRIAGSFNSETLVWKLDCFDKNIHHSVFIGKENTEGVIEGHWTSKKSIRRFYLKKTS